MCHQLLLNPSSCIFSFQIFQLSLEEVSVLFIKGIKETSALEYVAVFFGIISVVFSRMENIWVYPTGLINTVLFIYLCFGWKLYAEASVNVFYTIMSIYGWYLWARRKSTDASKKHLEISRSNIKEWIIATGFFLACWLVLYLILNNYSDSNVPLADSFAAAAAYTGMLLMARKKVESWIWWIITNIASIPLYFYKGAVFTSFQYLVFLILAVLGLITWNNKVKSKMAIN